MTERTLSPARAKAFYDRFGRKQDAQAFYEDAALDELVSHASLGTARTVFELGCGTGRLAVTLLRERLPEAAAYFAADLSTTMVRLAAERVRPFADRSVVLQIAGGRGFLPLADTSADRFVSTYVLDLLDEAAAAAVVTEAHRLLVPGGKLCVVGITPGRTVPSRLVMAAWALVQRISPAAVGGCRPIESVRLLPPSRWQIDHHQVVTSYGIASEVVVASKL
jgi:ubiquinone/menaquinone biosynthesis C-methylase UbiE